MLGDVAASNLIVRIYFDATAPCVRLAPSRDTLVFPFVARQRRMPLARVADAAPRKTARSRSTDARALRRAVTAEVPRL